MTPPWDKNYLMDSSEDDIVVTKENGTGGEFSSAPASEDIGWVYTIYEDMEGDTSSEPMGLTLGNDNQTLYFTGYIYVCDGYNYVVRRISSDEKEIITFAGSGLYGHRDGPVEYMMVEETFKDGYGPMFQDLYSLIRSPIDGTFYTSCRNYDRRIRKLKFHFLLPEKSQAWTVAGQSFPLGHVDGHGPLALFRSVSGMAIDHSNNIYLSDIGNNVVRRISSADGEVTTVVGDGRYIDEYANADFYKVEGPSRKVSLSGPNGIAVGPDNSLYIADTGARRIIKVVPNDAGWV
eukprot:jgi/Bigna1/144664/aug1.90_g19372